METGDVGEPTYTPTHPAGDVGELNTVMEAANPRATATCAHDACDKCERHVPSSVGTFVSNGAAGGDGDSGGDGGGGKGDGGGGGGGGAKGGRGGGEGGLSIAVHGHTRRRSPVATWSHGAAVELPT